MVLDKPPGSFRDLWGHASYRLREVDQYPAVLPHDGFPEVFE